MKEIPLHAYSMLRQICGVMLDDEENRLLTALLLKGSKSENVKYRLMLRVLIAKSFGQKNVYAALRNE